MKISQAIANLRSIEQDIGDCETEFWDAEYGVRPIVRMVVMLGRTEGEMPVCQITNEPN